MRVTTDPDHKFDLCLASDDLEAALEITRQAPSEVKWKAVGDRALQAWKLSLAEECFAAAGDLSGLLLIYSSTGSTAGLQNLAQRATDKGSNNIAFISQLLLGEKEACVDVLLDTDRQSEAALFSRTYAPSLTEKAVKGWKKSLLPKGKKIAETLGDPSESPDAFEEGWEETLERERVGATQQSQGQVEDKAPLTPASGSASLPAPEIVLSPPADDRNQPGKLRAPSSEI